MNRTRRNMNTTKQSREPISITKSERDPALSGITTEQIERQRQLLSSLKPKPGEKIFEWQVTTAEVREVKREIKTKGISEGRTHILKTVGEYQFTPGCLYVCATEMDEAKVKFATIFNNARKKAITTKESGN